MSGAFTISLSPQAQELMKRFGNPARAYTAMARALDKENQLTVSHIVHDYLSFSRSGPSNPLGLRVQSGSARRAVRATTATVTGGGVTSAIGGNAQNRGVNYLAVHEYGATIRPHTITATDARALCFYVGGKKIFAKSAKHPGMVLPARHMVRNGIRDRLPAYGAAMSKAVVDTLGGVN